MKPITKAQRQAIKRIFDRGPIYGDKSSSQLAMDAGWRFVAVTDLPENLRAKVTNPRMTHVWIHGKVTPIYAESDDIVRDYRLAQPWTYRQFRKSVMAGWDCLVVRWAGMTLGIEKDGYTHS